MNTLVIVLLAAVVLFAAYVLYGRWLAKKWGIDPAAKTPAVRKNDGKDYVPTNGWTVFSHQFSSIAGAGPVTGAIQAAAFGWVPVLLWVLIGGIFFGAVTDFGALYASVKNEGKSMGMLIEKYIGKLGRKLFLLFCWLFCGIVIAAFADMVAGTFNAYTVVDGVTQLAEAAQTNGAAGMVSIMFMVFAVVFGLVQKKWNLSGWKEAVLGVLFIAASFAVGMNCPLIYGKSTWSYITFVYIFFAAVLPMWLLKQPRDYMTTFMFIGMIAGAAVGLLVAHPTMNLPAFTSFNTSLGSMFPILFVTVACGAVSGFHSLVSSGTSSKTVENEKDMLKVGYGAMVLESLLAVLALCVAGAAAAADGTPAAGTPFQIFSRGVAGFFEMFGVPSYAATVFMTMCVSALALTSLDAVARIGRMSFQELFSVDDMAHAEPWRKLLCNTYFSTALTLAFGFLLTQIGYANIWPLCQPASLRARAHHAVRLPEGHGPQQQDALPAAHHHALRDVYGACPAASCDGQGHSGSSFHHHPGRRDDLGCGVHRERPAADHRGAAHRTGPDDRRQRAQELRQERVRQRKGQGLIHLSRNEPRFHKKRGGGALSTCLRRKMPPLWCP